MQLASRGPPEEHGFQRSRQEREAARRGDLMDKPRERAQAAVAAREQDSRSKGTRARVRRPWAQADEQAPARQVVVGGRTVSLPGLRFSTTNYSASSGLSAVKSGRIHSTQCGRGYFTRRSTRFLQALGFYTEQLALRLPPSNFALMWPPFPTGINFICTPREPFLGRWPRSGIVVEHYAGDNARPLVFDGDRIDRLSSGLTSKALNR